METCGEKQQELRKNTKRIFPNVEDIWAFLRAEIMVFVFISVIMHFAFPESPLGDESRDLLTLYGIVFTAIVALGIQIGLTNSYLRDQLDSMQDRGVEEQAKVLDKIGYSESFATVLVFRDFFGFFSSLFPLFIACISAFVWRLDNGIITPISLAFLCLFIHGLSFYSALIDNEILERIDMLIERRRSGVYEAMKSLNDLSIKSMMVAVYSCKGIPDVRQFKGRYGLEGLSPEKLARYSCGKGYIFRLISVELFYLVIVLCIFGNCVNHWDFTCLQLLAMCMGILLGSALLLCFWWVAPLLIFWGNKRGAMKVYGEIILRFSEKSESLPSWKSESLPSWMTVRAFSPFRSLVWSRGGSRK